MKKLIELTQKIDKIDDMIADLIMSDILIDNNIINCHTEYLEACDIFYQDKYTISEKEFNILEKEFYKRYNR